MRKAIRLDDGSIRVPRDMTDEEFSYALSIHTPAERDRLAKTLTSSLKWTVWRLRHPKLAALLDALVYAGHGALHSPFRM